MFIQVALAYPLGPALKMYRWFLVKDTGLVIAMSHVYSRRRDAVRIGKQTAKKLQLEFCDYKN